MTTRCAPSTRHIQEHWCWPSPRWCRRSPSSPPVRRHAFATPTRDSWSPSSGPSGEASDPGVLGQARVPPPPAAGPSLTSPPASRTVRATIVSLRPEPGGPRAEENVKHGRRRTADPQSGFWNRCPVRQSDAAAQPAVMVPSDGPNCTALSRNSPPRAPAMRRDRGCARAPRRRRNQGSVTANVPGLRGGVRTRTPRRRRSGCRPTGTGAMAVAPGRRALSVRSALRVWPARLRPAHLRPVRP